MVSLSVIARNGIGILADASIRPVLLAALAAVFLTLSRMKRADVRHAVWTLVLCTMLLMPFATSWLPAVPLRVLDSVRTVLMPAEPSPTPLPEGGSRALGIQARKGPARPSSIPFDWTVAVLAVYVAGFSVSAARVIRAYAQVRRIVCDATPAHRGAWESEFISVPMTVGLTIPVILLPKSWREWDRETLAAVLAHERAHVDRLDWLVAFVAALNRCIFWFHPLAWWLQKKIAALAEDAADDHSILAIGDRQQYASALVDIASALNTYGGRVTWETVAMARKANVTKRVDSILDGTRPLSRGLSRFAWIALLVISIPLFYGTAAAQLQSKEERRQAAGVKPEGKGGEVYVVINSNGHLTADEVKDIESRLTLNPEDLDSRAQLIAYYYANGKHEDRVRHVLWLIENHPDANALTGLAGSGVNKFATFIPRNPTEPGYVAGAYDRARDLWTANESKYADNVRALTNEAWFFAQTDLNKAESLLAHARNIAANPRMVEERFQSLYANVLFTATDPRRHTNTLLYDDPQFADHVKSMLLRSNDGRLVATFAKLLMESAHGLEKMGLDARERIDLSNQLSDHAKALGQPEPALSERREPAAAPAAIRVGGNVQAAKLIKKVDPAYPPLAKAAHIEGTVHLSVNIDPDGHVRGLETIDGHPLLINAARQAVEQWEYQPTFLNGNPVTVITTVEVNFALKPQE